MSKNYKMTQMERIEHRKMIEKYAKKNKLHFIDFSPSVNTWLNAFSALDFYLKKLIEY